MSGFEFQKQFGTIEEKMIVLLMDAVKTAYNMAGINFDELSQEEKIEILSKHLGLNK